jgi:hypothetical protein
MNGRISVSKGAVQRFARLNCDVEWAQSAAPPGPEQRLELQIIPAIREGPPTPARRWMGRPGDRANCVYELGCPKTQREGTVQYAAVRTVRAFK